MTLSLFYLFAKWIIQFYQIESECLQAGIPVAILTAKLTYIVVSTVTGQTAINRAIWV